MFFIIYLEAHIGFIHIYDCLQCIIIICSLVCLRINWPFYKSIIARLVTINGRSKINKTSFSSSMPKMMKSVGKMNFSTFTKMSSVIPWGCLIDQPIELHIVVAFASSKPNILYTKALGVKFPKYRYIVLHFVNFW